jgi:hypothetical protein
LSAPFSDSVTICLNEVLIEFLNCGIISSLYIAGKLLITEGDGLATVMVVQFQQHQLP